MTQFNVKGKSISIHNDGQVFVNGSTTNIKQWRSDFKRYSNLYGSEIKELKGKELIDVLKIKGFL